MYVYLLFLRYVPKHHSALGIWGFVSFSIDLHSFLSTAFLLPALPNLKRKFEFFFSTLFSPGDSKRSWFKQLLKNEFYCGEIVFLLTVVLEMISSSHYLPAEIEGLGPGEKEFCWGGVRNDTVDYYNLYTNICSIHYDNFFHK